MTNKRKELKVLSGLLKVALLFLMLLSKESVLAQVDVVSKSYSYAQIEGHEAVASFVRNESPSCTNGGSKTITKESLRGVINLGEDYEYGLDEANHFSTEILVSIEGYSDLVSTSPLIRIDKRLKIYAALDDYHPETFFDIDLTNVTSNVEYYNVEVSLICNMGNALIAQRALESQVRFEKEYTYSPSLLTGDLLSINPVDLSTNTTRFSWEPECADKPASNYEFQLLRLYNISKSTSSNERVITTNIDWDNALSIETGSSATELELTLTEGTGYYVWRVRPIGTAYKGGIGNSGNWGQWSSVSNLVDKARNISISNSSSGRPYLFFYTQFDDDKNWQYSRTFIEGDVRDNTPVTISEQISYSNSLQMPKQNQVKLNSEGKVLINQNIQDFSGRTAISTMAAPIDQSTLGYKTGYIKNDKTTPSLYTAKDFDFDDNYENPSKITSSALTDYYSDKNIDPTIPNAEGYPYSRVLYERDGTNRVKEQSAPGATHALKETGDKHTARYAYSSVADIELVRIFGDEAPVDTSVYKVISRDANNTGSISYISKEGNVIATCLSKPGSAQLDAIASQAEAGFSVQDEIKGNRPFGDRGFVGSKNVTFTEQTELTLNYDITPNLYGDVCDYVCESCDYTITLNVYDTDKGTNKFSKTIPIGPLGCSPAPSVIPSSPAPMVVLLEAGTYTIERKVQIANINPQTGNTYISESVDLLRNQLYDLFAGESEMGYLTDASGISEGADVDLKEVYAYLDENDTEGLYDYLGGVEDNSSFYIKLGCDVIEIPVTGCGKTTCDPLPDFEAMLIDKWSGQENASGGTYGETINDYMPEYEQGQFNDMMSSMLSFQNSEGIRYYDCEKVINCWEAMVENYQNLQGLYDPASSPDEVLPENPGLLRNFLNCTGYHLQGFTTEQFGEGGYLSEPYAYFYYDRANNPSQSCEKAIGECETSSCTATEFEAFEEEDWLNFYYCIENAEEAEQGEFLAKAE